MDLKLELVVVPVSDVDRAKAFYAEKAGFTLDVDHQASDEFRVVQLTPPGSACSITIGIGITSTAGLRPGHSAGRHRHRGRTRRACRARVEVSEIRHLGASVGTRRGSGAPRLRVVRRLQRPRRQQLGPPGEAR